MRLFARDHKNRAGLLSGFLDICDVLNAPAEITMIGLTNISNPTTLKSVEFLLVDEESAEEKTDFFLKQYIWEYIEISIETESNTEKDYTRVSKSTLRKVLDKWQSYDSYLTHNRISLDTYFSSKTFSQSGSFVLTKKDLMVLLSLKGNVSLRDVMSSFDDIEVVFFCIQKAIAHNILKSRNFSTSIDYQKEIETIGYRLNRLVGKVILKNIANASKVKSILEKGKEALTPDYKDIDCININLHGVDLTDVMTSFKFSLDKDVMATVGASIVKPLSYLYACFITNLCFEGSFEEIRHLLNEIEVELDNSSNIRQRKSDFPLEGKFA